MDYANDRIDWFRIGLVAAAVLLAILWGASLWVQQETQPYRTQFDVPIGPGHRIHVHIGNRQPWRNFQARYLEPAPSVSQIPRVELWYRTGRGWPGHYLGAFPLPTWPISALAVGLCLAAGTEVARRRYARR